MHSRTHALTDARTHARTPARARTHTHTHAHTQTEAEAGTETVRELRSETEHVGENVEIDRSELGKNFRTKTRNSELQSTSTTVSLRNSDLSCI